MIDIIISDTIKKYLPGIRLGCIMAQVKIEPSSNELLNYIDQNVKLVKDSLAIEGVGKIKVIAETKDAYRKLGKDPSRYRPSAEALIRRIVQEKGLYRVNNIVDALNIISIKCGFSIGGYDADMLDQEITLGIGMADEPYEAIGRGVLNIEGLPVLRDSQGAFGSPTSDSIRTMASENTGSFLMVFFDFMQSVFLEHAMDEASQIFKKFCGITEIEMKALM